MSERLELVKVALSALLSNDTAMETASWAVDTSGYGVKRNPRDPMPVIAAWAVDVADQVLARIGQEPTEQG